MGNNQSQDLEGDEPSTYNYHESVLRDAQTFSNTKLQGYESDDQYFSAEEGDRDSDRSITPTRTRPESSSGEDFSDDSESNNEDENNQNENSLPCVNESSTFLSEVPSKRNAEFLSPRVRKLAVKKSCGQCNVSRFQEHDSIGPELDSSRWDVNSSSTSSARTTRQSQRSQEQVSVSHDCSHRQTIASSSSSQFKPINSPPYGHNVSLNSANKRTAENPVGRNQPSPKRKRVIRISPNKRRLGLFEESDSGGSDEDRVKVIRKKPRHSRPNLLPSNSNDAELPSVAQSCHAKMKRGLNEAGEDENIDTEDGECCSTALDCKARKLSPGPETLTDTHVLGEGKRRKEGNELNEEIPTDSPSSKKLKTNQIQEIATTDSTQSDCGAAKSLLSGRGVKRLLVSAFQPIKRLTAASSHLECESDDNSFTKTVKMGNNAVRNSQGKVLPLRQSHLPTSSSSTDVTERSDSASYSVQTSRSDPTLVKNSLQLRKNDLLKPEGVVMQNVSPPSGSSQENRMLNVNHSQSAIEKETRNENSPIGKKGSSNDNVDHSPFHNVVLTPPSSQVSAANSDFQTQMVSNNSDRMEHNKDYHLHDSRENEIIAMETEEPEISMTSADSLDSSSSFHRVIAKAKRLSTTERFKNLKSNFKSFFSKRKSDQRASPRSNISDQSTWSLYSSSSPFASQLVSNFQSTSSPIATMASSLIGADSVNFSPISSSSLPSPSTIPQPKKQLVTSLLVPGRNGTPRKSSFASHIPTRTSPRLRHSRTSPPNATTNVSNASNLSVDSSDAVTSTPLSHHVVLLPQTSGFQVLRYCLSQAVEISLSMGDIAEQMTSGIVNWTDMSLTHAVTECSRRVCTKAGALMRAGCNSYLENKDGSLEAPDVLTTPAGGSFPRCVQALLHVVSPPSNNPCLGARLLEVNANCLRFANERLGLESLSIPLIGEGELPTRLCAEAFIDAVFVFITELKPKSRPSSSPSSSPSSASLTSFELTSIHLVTEDANITDEAAEVIQARIDFVKSNGLECAAAEIRDRYYATQNSTLMNRGDGIEQGTVDRAASGRLRVKRPRL